MCFAYIGLLKIIRTRLTGHIHVNALRGRHTHAYITDKSNFKKPVKSWHEIGLKTFQ